jgi:hypothetical protein
MAGDVFKEAPPGLDLFDDPRNVGPEMPWIRSSLATARHREGLAGIPAHNEIHDSTPRLAVEGLEIRPKRRIIQGFVFHARSQDFGGVGFVLNVSDCDSAWDRQLDAEVESPNTGAEGENPDGT